MFDFEGSRIEFLKILAEMGEEPAYIARARNHENALATLLARCDKKRFELLEWPRRKFAVLRHSVADDWDQLATLVSDTNPKSIFIALASELLPLGTPSTLRFSTKRTLLVEFNDSARRFNRTWEQYLAGPGLGEVNRLRNEYNLHYPMEKSCAFGNDSINDGFRSLQMLDDSYLLSRYPLLLIPNLA